MSKEASGQRKRSARREPPANQGIADRSSARARPVEAPGTSARQLDAADILASVGEALYHWDIKSDVLTWSANVGSTFCSSATSPRSRQRPPLRAVTRRPTMRRLRSMPSSDPPSATRAGRRLPASEYCHPAGFRLGDQTVGRGQRPLVRWPRRQAGARTRHRPRHQRAPRDANAGSAISPTATSLTGELNRYQLTEILEKTIEEAVRSRSSCGFLLVAIDNLGASTDPTATISPIRSSAW